VVRSISRPLPERQKVPESPAFPGISRKTTMGRHSSVATHPERARVDRMLDDGVSYAEIARAMGLSISATSRYAIARKSELAKLADGDVAPSKYIERLVEIADHAREARRRARLSGSPVHQARMIKSEVDVITRLLSELGVSEDWLPEFVNQSEDLLRTLADVCDTNPEAGRVVIDALASRESLRELAGNFRSRMKAKHHV
jgi:hypothetical protein